MTLKGTKTANNLMHAFAGESQARNRYTYYASIAKKEGFVQIQNIFLETANQEKEHAKRLMKFMNKDFRKYVLNYTGVFSNKDKTLGEFCDKNNINLESISLKEINEKLTSNGFNPIPKKYIVVSNIKWDLDESDLNVTSKDDLDLSKKMILNWKAFSHYDVNELEEKISNRISDITGFCHDGFDYEIINVEDI